MGFFQKIQKAKRPFCTVIVVAAGNASRMKGVDKIMTVVGDKPVIAHTLLAFEACESVDEVIVVTRSDLIVPIGDVCKTYEIGRAHV